MNRPDRALDPRRRSQAQLRPQAAERRQNDAGMLFWQQTWVAGLILTVAAVVFYANTFRSPFVFDDKAYIAQKATLHHLWPVWTPMLDSSRPVVDFTFALNYAADEFLDLFQSGTPSQVPGENKFGPREQRHDFHYWTYHVVNLAIHLMAALILFDLVRRTLSRGALAPRYGQMAWGLGLGVALLWLLHPLQTESVTYVFQRFESLMGLFFLLTFYCLLRAQDSPRAGWWYVGSVGACLLAIGSKEVAAMAPPLLLWYDRVFLASGWRDLLRRRWPFYASLGGVLGLLAWLMFKALPMYQSGGILKVENIGPMEYARTQPGVILHYLQLSVWPQGQTLDYGWSVANTWMEIVPPLVVLLVLLGLVVWCIWRHPAWGFLGGWFFLILAPTSSFAPIKDLAFEHRMYLPLAAVVVALVIGGYELLQRLPVYRMGTRSLQRLLLVVSLAVVAVALGLATHARNYAYSSEVSLWQDIVRKSPNHPRGHNNLGLMYMSMGPRWMPLAERHFRKAVKLDPKYYDAHYNLGQVLMKKGPACRDEAIQEYEICLNTTSWFRANSYHNLALLLLDKGEVEEARRNLEIAAEMDPKNPIFHHNLTAVIAKTDPEAAIRRYQEALRLFDPNSIPTMVQLAAVLEQSGRRPEALHWLREALKRDGESPELHYRIARLLPPDDPKTLKHLVFALEREPGFVEARKTLADILVRQGRTAEAMIQYQQILQITPQDEEAQRRFLELSAAQKSQKARPASGAPGSTTSGADSP